MHKQGSTTRALLNSFAILTSIALQHGVPLEEIASAFVHTKFEPRGMTFGDPDVRISSSLLDYVFRTLSIRYLGRSDLRTGGDQDAPSDQKAVSGSKPVEIAVGSPAPGPRVDVKSVEICAQCGDSMIRSGSCFRCNNCGSTSGCS
jgi:ribonucleoside-diphosphate reductase alpha chain